MSVNLMHIALASGKTIHVAYPTVAQHVHAPPEFERVLPKGERVTAIQFERTTRNKIPADAVWVELGAQPRIDLVYRLKLTFADGSSTTEDIGVPRAAGQEDEERREVVMTLGLLRGGVTRIEIVP